MASVHISLCTRRQSPSPSRYLDVGYAGRQFAVLVCVLALAACTGPIKLVPTQRSDAPQPPSAAQTEPLPPEQTTPPKPVVESPVPLPAPPVAESSRSAEGDLPVVEANPVLVVAKRDGYVASRATTGTKTDTPIMETPANVQVITQQVMKDQQVIVLDQALKNVSGVTTDSSNFRQGNQAIVLRGFASSTYFRNGFRLQDAAASRAMANIESIEILKGPAAILYGLVGPGGMVNVVTKQPLTTPYYSLTQQFGSYDLYRTTMDATGPLTKDDTLLYRMNASYENSGSFR